MALIVCGIDEAGYGPLLGPLCVSMAAMRVDEWAEGSPAPDLWKLLSPAVCKKPGSRSSGSNRSIAIDDSKRLKLANSSTTHHPLYHLERGVLSMLACRGDEQPKADSDVSYFLAVGAASPGEVWYRGEPIRCPVGSDAALIAINANVVRGAMANAGVCVQDLRCEVIGEREFNEVFAATGNKAAVNESALVRHLWRAWERWGQSGGIDSLRVVCDRQGGRTQYAEMLGRAFPDATVQVLDEGVRASRYEVAAAEAGRRMIVLFMTEAESAHLPVALASMCAKLTREMLMARLNRYWRGRMPELKPTAGYRQDGWRWLEDLREVVTAEERQVLIRRA